MRSQLAATAMWVGSIECGTCEEWECYILRNIFELLCFKDLNQEEQLSNGKDIQVEATVLVKAEIIGEMYVTVLFLS